MIEPNSTGGEVTQLLNALRAGSEEARSRLFELVYNQLRGIAAARMKAEAAGHTLTPTGLVHEAYVRLGNTRLDVADRNHFLSLVAQAMRHVLVDHARARRAAKRSGQEMPPVSMMAVPASDERLLAIDKALQELSTLNGRQSRVVELRYFAGFTEQQTATILGVTRRTVCRDWQIARAWLISKLQEVEIA